MLRMRPFDAYSHRQKLDRSVHRKQENNRDSQSGSEPSLRAEIVNPTAAIKRCLGNRSANGAWKFSAKRAADIRPTKDAEPVNVRMYHRNTTPPSVTRRPRLPQLKCSR